MAEKKVNKVEVKQTRRRLQGVVVSTKMQKTIVVETENYIYCARCYEYAKQEGVVEKSI